MALAKRKKRTPMAEAGDTRCQETHRLVEHSLSLFSLPALLFVLLSLPFNRIKTLIAKLKKAEGEDHIRVTPPASSSGQL